MYHRRALIAGEQAGQQDEADKQGYPGQLGLVEKQPGVQRVLPASGLGRCRSGRRLECSGTKPGAGGFDPRHSPSTLPISVATA